MCAFVLESMDDLEVSGLALGRLLNGVVEGRLVVAGVDDLALADLALETTGLGRVALQAEELGLHLLVVAIHFIRGGALRALLDRLDGEAQLLGVLQSLGTVDWLGLCN